jgi:hypothetical protein
MNDCRRARRVRPRSATVGGDLASPADAVARRLGGLARQAVCSELRRPAAEDELRRDTGILHEFFQMTAARAAARRLHES